MQSVFTCGGLRYANPPYGLSVVALPAGMQRGIDAGLCHAVLQQPASDAVAMGISGRRLERADLVAVAQIAWHRHAGAVAHSDVGAVLQQPQRRIPDVALGEADQRRVATA